MRLKPFSEEEVERELARFAAKSNEEYSKWLEEKKYAKCAEKLRAALAAVNTVPAEASSEDLTPLF